MDPFAQLRSQMGEYGGDLHENIIMKDQLALGVAGVSDYYFKASTVPALVRAIEVAHRQKIPWAIVGHGDRLLIPEVGFNGLVIHNVTKTIALSPGQSQVIVDSGVLIQRLIMEAIGHDLGGLEFLTGVNGSVGGALWFNAAQFGFQIAQYVRRVTICLPDGAIEYHPVDWFKFGQNRHRFSDQINTMIFLSVTFQFHPAKKHELMRRVEFYKSRIPPSHKRTNLVKPLFRPPDQGLDIDQILGKVGTDLNNRQAKLVNGLSNAAEFGSCSSTQIRQWIENLKERVRQSSGVILDELIHYVGQW